MDTKWPIIRNNFAHAAIDVAAARLYPDSHDCSMSETVDITRYPNRRLYDRSRKKYVTLGDIEEMVVGGQDVCVRDSKSEEDLTRVILTQIMIERHPERMKMFPLPFLHAMLRADQMAIDWLTVYFGQATTFMEGIPVGSRIPNVMPGMEFWQSLMSGGGTGRTATPPTEETEPTPEQVDEPVSDNEADATQDMAAKLAEMERRLNELESKPSADGQ